MATQNVMNGARSKVVIVNPNTGKTEIIGIFNSVSYSVSYDVRPIDILGRHSFAELLYLGADPVQLTVSGWRVVNEGVYKSLGFPKLQDLLTFEGLTFIILDRQTNLAIATIKEIKPVSFSTTSVPKQAQELTVQLIGRICDEENTANEERADAVKPFTGSPVT
jgi:hypothetical protein